MKQEGQGSKIGMEKGLNGLMVVKGIVISYLITIPIFLIFALILSGTNCPEKLITPIIVATTILSILFAGISIARKSGTNGWINGAVVGLIYMLVLYILSSIVFKTFAIDRYVVTMTVIGVLSGAIGGIFGVNMKAKITQKHKHKR